MYRIVQEEKVCYSVTVTNQLQRKIPRMRGRTETEDIRWS